MFSSLRISERAQLIAFILIGGMLVLRLLQVLASPLELYADEAQYWRWSETLAWGYYSKPPMIAWVIATSTALFGDSEWAIRLAAPLLHAFSASILFLLARRMFGNSAALFTTLTYVFMPGVVLSSSVIATDGVLFPFWVLSLYLYWRLRESDLGWLGTCLLGLSLGLGFLSKYAMLYFVIGLALTSLVDRPSRRALFSRRGGVSLGLALLVLAPHLLWNAQNGFETVSHTVDNANLGGSLFNLENLPVFLTDQAGVFGPVAFIMLIAALTFVRPQPRLADLGAQADSSQSRELWLACFIVPVILIIAFQAVLSRAHANWAATAYPAASVLIGGFLVRAPAWRPAFWGGIVLQIVVMVLAAILALGPPSWSAAIGRDNDLKRVRGWQDLSAQLIAEVERLQPTVIVTDEREIWHGLDYYMRTQEEPPLILWRYNAGPKNFAEKVDLADLDDNRVLVASYRSHLRPRIKADFETWEPVGRVGVDLGHRSNGCPLTRELRLYLVSDYQPLTRDQAWIDQFKRVDESGRKVNTHIDRLPVCPPVPQ